MNETTATPEPSPERGDIARLARELAAAFRDRVLRYKHELGLSTEEAAAKAEQPCSLLRVWEIQDASPEEITWADLEELNRRSPELALQRCEELKQAARDLLRSGDLAGAVMEGQDPRPWQRAEFLAIREDLSEDWRPRIGIERQLIDMMAQALAAKFSWEERLALTPHVAGPEAAEHAGAMVDRFHKMFLRTLRALQELRRHGPTVLLQNVGPVQVGGQQLNTAQPANGRDGDAPSRGAAPRQRRRPAACTCPADQSRLIGES
jgi:ribosome-binding protein aMBF1 (putative translation factor)